MSDTKHDDEDCLPHGRAVWRDYLGDGRRAYGTRGQRVSLDYGSGPIVCCMGDEPRWTDVKRWRFGWPPRDGR